MHRVVELDRVGWGKGTRDFGDGDGLHLHLFLLGFALRNKVWGRVVAGVDCDIVDFSWCVRGRWENIVGGSLLHLQRVTRGWCRDMQAILWMRWNSTIQEKAEN